MSDHNTNNSGGNGSLAFIVGGLVVAVAVIAWLVFGGSNDTATTDAGDVTVTVEGAQSDAQEAADAVGDAAQDTANAVGDAANDAANAVGDAANDAADAVEDATNNN